MPIFYFHDLMDFKDPTYARMLREFGEGKVSRDEPRRWFLPRDPVGSLRLSGKSSAERDNSSRVRHPAPDPSAS